MVPARFARKNEIVPIHPSLTAPLVALPALSPRPTMDRNEPCWCRSGLKWKKCHKDRAAMAPLTESELFEKENALSRDTQCLHPLAPADCGTRIIASHTIQKRVGLKAIEENGHVLSVRRSLAGLFKTSGRPEPERRGVQTASTFPGFCEKHDSALFRPIETQKWKATKESAFLLSFRAMAWETYAKLNAKKLGEWQKLWADRGQEFSTQIGLQQTLEDHLAGVRLGIRDACAWKKQYDDIYISGDYRDYHYLAMEFRPLLPIVACGGMHVEQDFHGRTLQDLIREVPSYEHMTLNITASEGISIVIFGWVGDPTGPSHEFARSFLMLPPDRQSHALIRLAFEHFENTFLRPSWWQGLEGSVREALKRRMQSGGPSTDRPTNCLAEDNLSYFAADGSTSGLVV